MSTPPTRRHDRRVAAREAKRQLSTGKRPQGSTDTSRFRLVAFSGIAVAVLLLGGFLAFGDFFGQRSTTTSADAIPVRLSMAGFTPADIRVRAGATATLDLWTTDAAPHLEGGVHTLISDALGLYEELPAAAAGAESRKQVTITAPSVPGSYDIWCDTCCGGKASPTMHGRLIVEA